MSFWHPLENRQEAGRLLGKVLSNRKFSDPIVLAMPRGGIPVAIEIAKQIEAPVDFIFVRRIGFPGHKEVALAAIVDGANPEFVLNEDISSQINIPQTYIDAEVKSELKEIERRRKEYVGRNAGPDVGGRSAILVDDGIATGTSIRAAIKALRRKAPKELIIAVPVAPADVLESLRPLVDAVVCLRSPDPFYAVGLHYKDFHQVGDEEIAKALAEWKNAPRRGQPAAI